MAVEIDSAKINEMSLEQMRALGDQLVAEEAGAAVAQTPTPQEPPAPQASTTPPAEPGTTPAEQAAPAAASPAPASPAPGEQPAAAPAAKDEDLTKHIAPPSKWAAERHAKKELQRQLEETQAKAAKADVLESTVNQLKDELTAIKTAIQDKGIKLTGSVKDPAAAFTPEKMGEIRTEFGDELADMIEILKAQAITPAAQAPTGQPAPAAPAATAAPAQPSVDPELIKAIEANDELSYWQENSPALWSRAVAKDGEMLANPEYAKLPYADRFAKVVESVKHDVMQGATKTPGAQDGNSPPAASLSGAPGVPVQSHGNDPLSQMEAITDPTKQMAFYNSQPQKVRDEIDKALGI